MLQQEADMIDLMKDKTMNNDYVEELMSKIKIGVFDCSSDVLAKGLFNIQDALENYKLYYETPNFKPNNYFKTETL